MNYKVTFEKEIAPEVQKELGLKNVMAVPRLKKIVVNASTRDFLSDKKNLEKAAEDLGTITGQKPKIAKAKVSIATFKLREGDQIGLVVTLRGNRMYDFYEKLVKIVFPRVRDFSGVSEKWFDHHGNLTIGFAENTVFPEIDPGKVDKIRSLQVVIVTNAGNDQAAKVLLTKMGMPFKKGGATGK
ncbi:MAG: 50S ribosomal protein L5 [Candidatus Levyibacteriota bacterium]